MLWLLWQLLHLLYLLMTMLTTYLVMPDCRCGLLNPELCNEAQVPLHCLDTPRLLISNAPLPLLQPLSWGRLPDVVCLAGLSHGLSIHRVHACIFVRTCFKAVLLALVVGCML